MLDWGILYRHDLSDVTGRIGFEKRHRRHIDQDRSVLSMRIRDAARHPFFKPVEDVRREDSDELMDKGEFTFILKCRPFFSATWRAGRNPDLQLLVDATSI